MTFLISRFQNCNQNKFWRLASLYSKAADFTNIVDPVLNQGRIKGMLNIGKVEIIIIIISWVGQCILHQNTH